MLADYQWFDGIEMGFFHCIWLCFDSNVRSKTYLFKGYPLADTSNSHCVSVNPSVSARWRNVACSQPSCYACTVSMSGFLPPNGGTCSWNVCAQNFWSMKCIHKFVCRTVSLLMSRRTWSTFISCRILMTTLAGWKRSTNTIMDVRLLNHLKLL